MSFEGFKPQRDLGVIGEKEGSGGDIENNKFSEEIINFIGKHNEHTDKIDKDFGHEWNLANLSYEDVYYFGCNRGKFDKVTQTFSDDGEYIESFYNTLVQLNPILKNVKIKNKTDMVNVIRGIGSGLHVNDIKFFTEDLELKRLVIGL